MNRPTTSVLLPASGAGRLLAAAIDRVLAQRLQPDELIIAVAARDAAALETAQGYAARYPDRVVLRSHGGPAGLAHDFDTALRAARGEVVALADAEEIWPDDYLARAVAELDAGGAYCCFAATAGRELSALGLGGRGYAFLRRGLARAGDVDTTLALFPHWELAARIALTMPATQLDATIDTVSASRGYTASLASSEAQRIVRQHAGTADPAARGRIADELEDLMATLAGAPREAERTAALLELPYHAPAAEPGGRLLFLASLPRSGSTLLQRMFAGHPDIHSLPEPWVMLHPAFGLRQADIEAAWEPALSAKAVAEFSERCGNPALQVEATRAGTDRLYDEALAGSGCSYFLDKTPRYFHILPELKRIYPAAAVMVLLRHPLAVFASTLAAWHDDDPERLFASPNYRDLIDGPKLLLAALNAPDDSYTIVRYEALVSEPGPQLERLCVAAGLPYWDGMLSLAESRLPRSDTFGDPGNAWRTAGPETGFMDAWQARLEEDVRLRDAAARYIAELGAEVFEQLGYALPEAWAERARLAGAGITGERSARDNTPAAAVAAVAAVAASPAVPPREAPLEIITSIAPFELEKQRRAVDSWLALGFRVSSMNIVAEQEQLAAQFPDVNFVTPPRDGREVAGKPMIYFDDIVEYWRRSSAPVGGIVNSDIYLGNVPGLMDILWREAQDSLVISSRVDVDSIDVLAGDWYPHGFDLFFFDRNILECYCESGFMIGMPWWDYWAPTAALLGQRRVKRMVSPVAYHARHPANYSDEMYTRFAKEYISRVTHSYLAPAAIDFPGIRITSSYDIQLQDLWQQAVAFIEARCEPLQVAAIDAEALNVQGEALYRAGHAEAAADVFQAAAEHDPDSVRILNNLATVNWDNNDSAAATELLARALEIAPLDRTTVLNAGAVLKAVGEPARARSLYSAYLDAAPDDEEVQALLGAAG